MSDLPPILTSNHPPVAIDSFIAAFGEFGLIGEEIADVIWLALEIQQYEHSSLSNADSLKDEESEKADKSSPNLIDPRKPIDTSTPLDSSATPSLSDAPQQAELHASEEQLGSESASGSRDLAIRLADARSLQEPLTLARSLLPLLRRVPSANVVLDEPATIERIAEEQLWMPVVKPDLEPWLELALVVDESKSMLLWQRTIRELQRLLERYGIFRDVRTWGMVIEPVVDKEGKTAQQIRIRPGIGKAARNQRYRSPRELIDAQGRRLVLIATDCVASHWYDGTVLSALRTWSQSGSIAIIQMLPEWLWSRTALGLAAPVRFRALLPGLPSQRLQAKPLSTWDEIDFEHGIQVPIVTLEPEIFTVWSQLVAGKGGVWAPGFVFEPELFELDGEEEDSFDHDLYAEQRVSQFYNSASPMAWKLACLLAAAPVINLPVVRIVQYEKLPKSRQVHTAEVFLGGLLSPSQPLSEITPDTNPDTIRYVFVEGVREALLESSLRSESINVFEVVSQYISDKKTTQEFVAYLKDPKKIKDGEFQSHPIAQISAQILNQLGGQYAGYAKQLEGIEESSADENGSSADEEAALSNGGTIKPDKQPGGQVPLDSLLSMGRYEEALPLYQNALEIRLEQLGERHPDVATSYDNLAGFNILDIRRISDNEYILSLVNRAIRDAKQYLSDIQRASGGWGIEENAHNSSPHNTGEALVALFQVGDHDNETSIHKAVQEYFLGRQCQDGGWTNSQPNTGEPRDGKTIATSWALLALTLYREKYNVNDDFEEAFSSAQKFLIDVNRGRKEKGSWSDHQDGKSSTTATCYAIIALLASQKFNNNERKTEINSVVIQGLQWLSRLQNTDGGIGFFLLDNTRRSTTLLVAIILVFVRKNNITDIPERLNRIVQWIKSEIEEEIYLFRESEIEYEYYKTVSRQYDHFTLARLVYFLFNTNLSFEPQVLLESLNLLLGIQADNGGFSARYNGRLCTWSTSQAILALCAARDYFQKNGQKEVSEIKTELEEKLPFTTTYPEQMILQKGTDLDICSDPQY